jgi:hypothetical protein
MGHETDYARPSIADKNGCSNSSTPVSSQHVQWQLKLTHNALGRRRGLHSNKSKSCVTKNSMCTMWKSSSHCMSHFHLKIFTSPGCIWETNAIAWIAPNISLQMLVIRTCIHWIHTICNIPVFLTFNNRSAFMQKHHVTKKCLTNFRYTSIS